MTSIGALLRFAVQQQASDLHLSAGEPPMLRIHGDMCRIDSPALTAEDTHRLIFDVMNDAQRRTFQDKLECDCALPLDDTRRFRVNVFVQNRGEAAVFRTIPSKIPRFDDLGLPEVIRHLCDEEKGLVLADEGGYPVELRTPEAAALVESDGVEPELGQVLVALHVDVRRLGPVTGVEEEPVGASPEHGRHAGR